MNLYKSLYKSPCSRHLSHNKESQVRQCSNKPNLPFSNTNQKKKTSPIISNRPSAQTHSGIVKKAKMMEKIVITLKITPLFQISIKFQCQEWPSLKKDSPINSIKIS